MKTLGSMVFVTFLSLTACGGDDGTGDDTAAPDAEVEVDAAAGVQLTVKNYLAWCSVIVDGHAASPAATQVVAVTPSSTVDLSAVALSGFQLGTTPWHDTDGDTGNGEQGTVTGTGQTASSAATITVGATGDACAWVCCEFTGGGGCPTTDQCP